MTTPMAPPHQDGLLLPGLDGTNPLGFLAALGMLRVLDQSDQYGPVKLQWQSYRGTWVAKVSMVAAPEIDSKQFLRLLFGLLHTDTSEHAARGWVTFSDGDTVAIRNVLLYKPDSWSTCIGIEPLPQTDDSKRMSKLQIARKDYHVKAVNNLLEGIEQTQLERALMTPWDYADPLEGLTLHLDPSEDRRHAHQWNQPAGDPDRKSQGNMIAANRLAIEAFPFFPMVHTGTMAQTLGFQGHYMNDTFWTWPLWNHMADARVVGSLLALSDLQQLTLDTPKLNAMGIEVVFRTQRILVGKTPNLTPARAVMT